MTRGTRISLIVVAVLVLAYPLAAWVIGATAEHTWQAREQELSEQYPYLQVTKRDYRRGVYSTTENLTYRLRGPLLESLKAGGLDWSDLEVSVRNTIHHGPLPQMRAFAPATVDTEIILPPKVHEKLVALLGDRTGLTIHTRLHWLGGSTTVVHSPPFEQRIDDSTLAWRGIDGTNEFGRDLKFRKMHFTSPGLSLKSPEANMEIADLLLRSDLQSVFERVSVGSIQLTLARLDIDRKKPPESKVSVQNVSLLSNTSAQGEYVDMDVRFNADSLQAQQFSASHLTYEFRASHIHGPTLSTLSKSLAAAQSETAGSTEYEAKMQKVLNTDGVEILLHDPMMEMPRIGFAMPEGELLISMKMSLQGLTRAEFDGPPPARIAAFVQHVQASADLRIDTALLDKLLDSTGKGDRFAQQLQGLQSQGYLKVDGKALTTHLTYQGGHIQVNGQPFPPMPQGPSGPPGASGPSGLSGPSVPPHPSRLPRH